ncbi:MAG: MarR family transcriptional regulator [Chitinophagaceae bacterium]|nr:MarR family transcriptional regulator [Chitinophagaceae bacterium]
MKTSDSKYSKCIYFTSNALARKIEKLAIESWKRVNLSPSHGYLLMLLLEEPGMQPGNIAAQMQLTPSTITRLIEKLEAKKLVVRTADGKITNVYPSPRAKEMLPELKACVGDFYNSYSKLLGAEESNKLVQSMNRISDKLTD